MAYGCFFLADWIIDYLIFYLPFIAHKALAIELTQVLFAEPARQRNREMRALETRSGYWQKNWSAMAAVSMAPGNAPFEARQKIRTKKYYQFQPLPLSSNYYYMLCDTSSTFSNTTGKLLRGLDAKKISVELKNFVHDCYTMNSVYSVT